MFLVQSAHERILCDAGLAAERRAEDVSPPPSLECGPIYSIYVDNIIIAGRCPQEVSSALVLAKLVFEKRVCPFMMRRMFLRIPTC